MDMGSLTSNSQLTFNPTGGPSSTGFISLTGVLRATKYIAALNDFLGFTGNTGQGIVQTYHAIQLAGMTQTQTSLYSTADVGIGADSYHVVIPMASVSAAGLAVLGKASQTANYIEATTTANKTTTNGDVFYVAADGSVNAGRAGTLIGQYNLAGNTSGTISIKPQAAAGTYNFNMPITAGTAGQLLTSQGGSSTAMTWTSSPTIQGTADLTAQTTAGNITTFTVGASTATFNISSYINVTAVSVDVIQGQITYTDENNTAQTVSLSNISAIGNSTYSPITIRAKNATVITVKTNLTTGAGTITFDAGARITQL
jgi:hypothetical protein